MAAFTHHPYPNTDLTSLLEEVNQSPYIGELTLWEVESYMDTGTIRFLYDDSVLIGFAAWIPVNDQWREIGPIYTLEQHRGHGYGRLMFAHILEVNQQERLNLYGVTKNAIVKRLFLDHGFHQVRFINLPPAIKRHLFRKMNLRRVMRLSQKRSDEPMAHFVKRGQTHEPSLDSQ